MMNLCRFPIVDKPQRFTGGAQTYFQNPRPGLSPVLYQYPDTLILGSVFDISLYVGLIADSSPGVVFDRVFLFACLAQT